MQGKRDTVLICQFYFNKAGGGGKEKEHKN
jgi:hypothetical protein